MSVGQLATSSSMAYAASAASVRVVSSSVQSVLSCYRR